MSQSSPLKDFMPSHLSAPTNIALPNMSLPNLLNYRSFEPTKSCYLDGNYFNMVFRGYGGLVESPLIIDMKDNDGNYTVQMSKYYMNPKYFSIIRVIIKTEKSMHSNVVLINHDLKKIIWFDPIPHPNGGSEYIYKIGTAYLKRYLGRDYKTDYTAGSKEDGILDERTPGCDMSGFCLAYCIKAIYDILRGAAIGKKGDYGFDNIRSFAAAIEAKYGPISDAMKDVEYGWGGAAGGFLGGAVLGGLVGGLVGGGAGAVGGALIGGTLGGFGGAFL